MKTVNVASSGFARRRSEQHPAEQLQHAQAPPNRAASRSTSVATASPAPERNRNSTASASVSITNTTTRRSGLHVEIGPPATWPAEPDHVRAASRGTTSSRPTGSVAMMRIEAERQPREEVARLQQHVRPVVLRQPEDAAHRHARVRDPADGRPDEAGEGHRAGPAEQARARAAIWTRSSVVITPSGPMSPGA